MRFTIRAAAGLTGLTARPAIAAEPGFKQVDAISGRSPAQSGDVYRYGFPRTDLTVTLDGVTIKPRFALVPQMIAARWCAMQRTHFRHATR